MFTKFPPALYKGLAKQDGNLFMSPFSVQVALGMALVGAEGETRRQLAHAIDAEEWETTDERTVKWDKEQSKYLRDKLGEPGKELSDREWLLNAYRTLVKEATPESKDIELFTANAAWVDERYTLKHTYTEALQSFGGDVQQVDYREKTAACDRINHWVSDNTRTRSTSWLVLVPSTPTPASSSPTRSISSHRGPVPSPQNAPSRRTSSSRRIPLSRCRR